MKKTIKIIYLLRANLLESSTDNHADDVARASLGILAFTLLLGTIATQVTSKRLQINSLLSFLFIPILFNIFFYTGF